MGSKFPRDGNWTLGKKNRVLTTRPPLDTKVKVAQTCPTLCNPKDYTVYGILQARILESVAIPFSRGSNPGFLHCRQILYHLSHQGSPEL